MAIAAEVDELAEARYQTAIQTFLVGKIDLLDLSDAQNAKDNARQDHILELYNYWKYYYNIRGVTLYDFVNNRTLDAEFETIIRQ